MNIYFGASITTDRSLLPQYKQLVETLKKLGHTVLSEYVVDPSLEPGGGLTAQQLFERETKTVGKADLMIAEITTPSWGTAFLMEHALKENVPVLALFYKDASRELPLMIQGHPEFYVAHYNDDNIHSVLKKNLQHFANRQQRSGKLIVIDGGDGAGKATQTKLLLEYLQTQHIPNKFIAFPRYHSSFHGQNVGRFLSGEFGGNDEVSPYLASLAFALDRLTARDEIVEWLDQGNTVVADRYTSANMAHQAAKLPADKRDEFIDWIYNMEYKEHKLPKEDVVIFLYVPVEVSQKLLLKKTSDKYVQGKDIHEKDVNYQKKSIEMYKELAQRFPHWQMIECVDEAGELLSIEEIHEKILSVLRDQQVIV